MTDLEINKAIAEHCGLSLCTEERPRAWRWFNSTVSNEPEDFVSDLNAMHIAEQAQWLKDWNSRHEFIRHIGHIDMLDATARQRAEAFLRTVGKWEATA